VDETIDMIAEVSDGKTARAQAGPGYLSITHDAARKNYIKMYANSRPPILLRPTPLPARQSLAEPRHQPLRATQRRSGTSEQTPRR
jgi:hypothetical protein